MPPKSLTTEEIKRQAREADDLWSGFLGVDETITSESTDRSNVAPPPQPEKDRRENPYGMVDVITFCEHPYYLNQKLYPWQILVLKGFYAGNDGNRHLTISDGKPEIGCEGCAWKYNLDSEVNHIKQITEERNGKVLNVENPRMKSENSPCLECNRFDDDARDTRYEYLLECTSESDEEFVNQIKSLRLRELRDRFETEMDLLFDPKIYPNVRNQFIEKVQAKKRFNELVMVMGRRSGKSFLVSVIALYETYRLLMMGNPQKIYPMAEGDIITICNVAVSESQALNTIFKKILEMAKPSPFMSKYIGKETLSELHFLTPHDMEENERRAKTGQGAPLSGTVQLFSGHSNSDALVGRNMYCIIIDELAGMAKATSSGLDGADYSLYEKLKPAMATFGRDGKIISLSNPLGEIGLLWDLYNKSFQTQLMLMMQLPTELANPNVDKSYLARELAANPTTFSMQFKAEFGKSGSNPFLPRELVENAFSLRKHDSRIEFGAPLIQYFAHLDPAGTGSDNYALVILHAEPITNMFQSGIPEMRIVVDHIHIWESIARNHPVNPDEVDIHVLNLAKRFRFVQVSYDQWNSQSAIAKLKAAGINAIQTPFTMHYQDLIFINLRDLLMQDRISFYGVDTQIMKDEGIKNLKESSSTKEELLGLQQRWKGKHYKVEAKAGGKDDITDCVASAAYQCLLNKSFGGSLPKSRVARLGYGFR